jgi:hypothetical protein
MAYATEQQARDAGAVGTSVEVVAAVAAADAAIDRYTADSFAPYTGTVVADVAANGVALLHRRVQSVTAVRLAGSSTTIGAGAYRVTSSDIPGEVDAVQFGGAGLYDELVVGAEPWNGGYVGLVSRAANSRVEVEGSFGWDAPPPQVVQASALLAAMSTIADAAAREAAAGSEGIDVDDEGNVLSITVNGMDPATGEAASRTTGNASVDAMLAPFVRSRTRLA